MNRLLSDTVAVMRVPSALLLLAGLAAPLAAQTLDPFTAPTLGAAPKLALPAQVQGTLATGLRYTLVEQHEVPLVQITLEVNGGARIDGAVAGLASFTANMLDEGAGTRDALGLAAESEFLGAELRTYATWNAIGVSLSAPKRTLDEAAALMADVVLRPVFAADEVTRQRDLRLAAILQQRDQPNGMAALAFGNVMYPAGHPYRRPIGGDSAGTVTLDSAMVRRFWTRVAEPRFTRIIITGDVTPAEAQALLERHFGGWTSETVPRVAGKGTPEPAPRLPLVTPRVAASTIYLVDKPGAAQSVIRIGQPGRARNALNWPAFDVMNTILGGSFSSRLNNVLRETKGYTYGARSGFEYQPIPGAWTASAEVRTDVTDSSLVEFVREFRRLRDEPPAPAELDRAKQYLTLGLLGDFETTGQLAGQVATVQTLGLPWQWYAQYQDAIGRVTAVQVQQAARTQIDPARLTILVVGDLAKIRSGIERLGLGTVQQIDLDGRPVVTP